MTREEGIAALGVHRREIDSIDVEIVKLLNQRTRVVENIGRIKRECELPIYEPRREDDVFRNITENNPGPLSGEAVRRVFERIIDEARNIQRDRMMAQQAAPKPPEEKV